MVSGGALARIAGRALVRTRIAWLQTGLDGQLAAALDGWRGELDAVGAAVSLVREALATAELELRDVQEPSGSQLADRLARMGQTLESLMGTEVLPTLGRLRQEEGASTLAVVVEGLEPLLEGLEERILAVPADFEMSPDVRPQQVPRLDVALRAIARRYLEGEVVFGLNEARNESEQLIDRVSQRLAEVTGVVGYGLQSAISEARSASSAAAPMQAIELARGSLERAERIVQALQVELVDGVQSVSAAVRDATGEAIRHIRRDALGETLGQTRGRRLRRGIERKAAAAQDRFRHGWSRLVRLPGRAYERVYGSNRARQERLRRGVDRIDPASMAASVAGFTVSGERVENLPYVLTKLFDPERGQDVPQLPVGAEPQIAALDRAWTRYSAGTPTAVLITGADGSGKSSITWMSLRRLAGRQLTGVVVDPLARSEAGLTSAVAAGCGAFDCSSWRTLRRTLLGRRRVILLDGLEHAFTRTPEGVEHMRNLLQAIAATRASVMWLVSVSEPTARYLDRLVGLSAWFTDHVHFAPRDADALGRIVDARCRLSGFDIDWPALGVDARGWRQVVAALRKGTAEQRRDDFYAQLAQASGGNVRDAMALWLNAVEEVAGDRVRMRPVARPGLAWFEQLGRDAHRVLALAILTGSITSGEVRDALGCSPAAAHGQLALLEGASLLCAHPDDSERRIIWPPVWRRVAELLELRRLVPPAGGAADPGEAARCSGGTQT